MRPSLLLPAVLVAIAACAHVGTPASAMHETTPERRHAEFLAAMTARDAERIAPLFAANAVVHVANMPALEGRDAIRRFYGNMFRFLASSTGTPGRMELSEGGDMAWTTGTTMNEFRNPDGTTVTHDGKYVIIWRRRGGEWEIAFYGVSSDSAEGRRQ